MDVLKVTKSISFDRIKDVTRFNDIDVSFLYVDKNKSFFYQKKKTRKRVKHSNGLKFSLQRFIIEK